MKKLMWTGFYIEMIMLIILFLLIFLQKPIPDLVTVIFAGGMFACIISSFFVHRKSDKKGYEKQLS